MSDLFRLLVDKALAKDTSDEIWGAKGYIFTENGEHVWGDLSRAIAESAASQHYISNTEEFTLGKDEALAVAGFEAVSWGLNSRGKAERAAKFLGWKPSRPSIEDLIGEILDDERKRLAESLSSRE